MGSRSASGNVHTRAWYATQSRIGQLNRQIARRRKEIRKLKLRLKWEAAREESRRA